MAQAPWDVLGPAVASQTPAGIRKRYISSFIVLGAIFGPLLVATVIVGEIGPYFTKVYAWVTAFAAAKGIPAWLPLAAGFILPAFLLNLLFQIAPAALVWWEQKIAAHAQVRLGPM